MRPLGMVLVVKGVLLGVFGLGFALASRGAFGNEAGSSAAAAVEGGGDAAGTTARAQGGANPAVPALPREIVSASEAERIRANLELLRRDAELKTKALLQARQTYDRTRRLVEDRLREVKEQRALLDDTLQKEKETKSDRLKEALVFLERMEPRKAAPVVESMDRDLVIALFKRLPPRVVTRLLENVSPRKATELMEYYTRIRSGREFALLRELGLCRDAVEEGEGPAGKGAPAAPPGTPGTPAAPATGVAPAATPAGTPAARAAGSGDSETNDKGTAG